ncbi:MAG: PIN domain-containing protein [bacterium]
MALVLDTGPLLAALDSGDPAHKTCVRLLAGSTEPLVIPSPVLVELEYWLRKRAPANTWQRFAGDVERGAYQLEHPTPADVVRAATLSAKYADLDLGFVDAAVVALCERLSEVKVATLDHRHFGAVRPAHCHRFQMLPESP